MLFRSKLSGLDVKQKKHIGSKCAVMVDLARRLRDYQEDLDSGRRSTDHVKEIAELREAVSGLKLSKRFLSFVKRLTGGRI